MSGAVEAGIWSFLILKGWPVLLILAGAGIILAYVWKHNSSKYNFKFSFRNAFDLLVVLSGLMLIFAGGYIVWPQVQLQRLEVKQELEEKKEEIREDKSGSASNLLEKAVKAITSGTPAEDFKGP